MKSQQNINWIASFPHKTHIKKKKKKMFAYPESIFSRNHKIIREIKWVSLEKWVKEFTRYGSRESHPRTTSAKFPSNSQNPNISKTSESKMRGETNQKRTEKNYHLCLVQTRKWWWHHSWWSWPAWSHCWVQRSLVSAQKPWMISTHQKRRVEPKQIIRVWSGCSRELDSFV